MKKYMLLTMLIACLTGNVNAQDAKATCKFLRDESRNLLETGECPKLISALEILQAYERLAVTYHLVPSQKAEIKDLKELLATECHYPTTSTAGSFVNFRKTNTNGQLIVESVPAFIYSSFFMEEDAKNQYLKNLDDESLAIYQAWKEQHNSATLLLTQETDKLKQVQRERFFNDALKKIDLKKYNFNDKENEKFKQDLKEASKTINH